MSDRLRPLIGRAAEGPLTREQAEAAFTAIMDGDATPAQVGGFLMALRTRGETVAEYAAAAAVMRAKCVRVRAPEGAIDQAAFRTFWTENKTNWKQAMSAADYKRVVMVMQDIAGKWAKEPANQDAPAPEAASA